MLLKTSSISSLPLLSSIFKPTFSLPKLPPLKPFNFPCTPIPRPSNLFAAPRMSWLNKFGFGLRSASDSAVDSSSSIAQGPDDDTPAPGQEFAQFGAGCFWGTELAFQRVPGVTKTEVGYTQGYLHNPTYEDVCTGTTNHSEVVRLQYDPKECSFEALLDVFWARHDPTTLNRQGNDVGTQYRSGIYFYTPEQKKSSHRVERQATKTPRQRNCHRDTSGQEILPSRGVSPAVPCKRWPIWFQAIKRERLQRPNSMLRLRITIHYYTTYESGSLWLKIMVCVFSS